MKTIIRIGTKGHATMIGGDDARAIAREIGPGRTRRASHVEPTGCGRRLLFRLIRATCRSTSRAAAWTRTWDGPWTARVVGGPNLGTFPTRSEAIDAELEHFAAEADWEATREQTGKC